jgi:hypothetical protein
MTIGDWFVGLAVGVSMAAAPGVAPERLSYGSAASQFGELWLPSQSG